VQVVEDRVGVFLLRAADIGVVEALDEASLVLQREQPVEQRRASVADMDVTRRRRGETNGNSHGGGLTEDSGHFKFRVGSTGREWSRSTGSRAIPH
jgi:hypothetical protein